MVNLTQRHTVGGGLQDRLLGAHTAQAQTYRGMNKAGCMPDRSKSRREVRGPGKAVLIWDAEFVLL